MMPLLAGLLSEAFRSFYVVLLVYSSIFQLVVPDYQNHHWEIVRNANCQDDPRPADSGTYWVGVGGSSQVSLCSLVSEQIPLKECRHGL